MAGEMTAGPLPVSIAELKAYLRLETDIEDGVLATLLRAAVGQVEAWLGVALVRREFRQLGVAVDGRLSLLQEPLEVVLAVAAVGADGTETTIAAADWSVERPVAGPPILCLADGATRPVCVRYIAGLGGDWNGVPEAVRQAVMRAAAHGFANRDGGEDTGLPASVRQMLAPFRRTRLI